jgi:hypothetical protein
MYWMRKFNKNWFLQQRRKPRITSVGPIEGHHWFSRFLANESFRRTGLLYLFRQNPESIARLPPFSPIGDISGFSRFPANESLRRTGLNLFLSAKSGFDHPALEISSADSLKDYWYLPRRAKPVFDERDLGQTNEQQRHFNEEPISELHGKVDSIQTSLKLPFPSSNYGISTLSVSDVLKKFEGR